MIKLKQLIQYPIVTHPDGTESRPTLEATWVEVTTEITKKPIMTTDEDGKEVDSGEFEDVDETKEAQIKCHAYDASQIDMLRADAQELGTPLIEYEALIVEVEANIVPPPPHCI